MSDRKLSAIIADDEAHMRTYLKLLLKDLGFDRIYSIINGNDAFDAYQEYKPDLVLMDINMSHTNGLDALGKITEYDPNALVIMMTAVSTMESVETSSERGAANYILKTQSSDNIKKYLGEFLTDHFKLN